MKSERVSLSCWSRVAATVLGLVMVAGFAASVPANASYGPPGKPFANPAFAVPLTGSVTTSQTTWATVVMGKNDGDFDLFWQLFVLDPSTGRFALVTPPGVADNGGLMFAADGGGTTSLVGFGASQGLKFSPLALTTNAGRSWSPGGISKALVTAPSAVALNTTGHAVALVGGASQSVLSLTGSLTDWKTLVTKAALNSTPAGKTCSIGSLGAVGYDSAGTPLVGGACRRPDAPGVFVDSDAEWHLADIPVPNNLAAENFATLRLDKSSALLAGVKGKATNLFVAWELHANRPWVLSPPLPIEEKADLLASGTGPGTTEFVLVRSGNALRAEVISAPTARWHALPSLPKGTATIAFTPTGQIDALSVDVTKLLVWHLSADGRSWEKAQTIDVPIAFGSSS